MAVGEQSYEAAPIYASLGLEGGGSTPNLGLGFCSVWAIAGQHAVTRQSDSKLLRSHSLHNCRKERARSRHSRHVPNRPRASPFARGSRVREWVGCLSRLMYYRDFERRCSATRREWCASDRAVGILQRGTGQMPSGRGVRRIKVRIFQCVATGKCMPEPRLDRSLRPPCRVASG